MPVVQQLTEAARFVGKMTWDTWWALVLGFTVAGAVQAFVKRETMADVLGGRGWNAVGKGTLFGFLSSSCSFGAVATTKSVFKKGGSPEASFAAFQFASTNLVIELGLVMWIILGWQFVVADFVGGLLMILLLAAGTKYVVPDPWFEAAREHTRNLDEGGGHDHGSGRGNWREELFTVAGWRRTFRNAINEWDMLWTDIVAGFVVAGLIKAFVPSAFWTSLFSLAPQGTFAWVLLGCLVGVVVGVATFICSVGNVPFAFVLWQSGIPFGGVMSYIFADLIVPHIVNMYRKYYGLRMAAALFVGIFVTAAVSGVVLHFAWGAIGLIPRQGRGGTAPETYTLVLNGIFTVVFLAQVYVTFFEERGEHGEEVAHAG